MNTIPGTDMQASAGVKSAFHQYLDDKAAREAAKEAVTEVQEQAAEKTRKVAKPKAEKAPRSNDKKAAALKLFEANKEKGNGEIAKLISTELEITYANAYYYVTRVFTR